MRAFRKALTWSSSRSLNRTLRFPTRYAGQQGKTSRPIFSKNSNVVVDVVPFKRPLLEGSCIFWYSDVVSLVLADGIIGSDQQALEAQVMSTATDVAVRLSGASDHDFTETLDLHTDVRRALALLRELDTTAQVSFEEAGQDLLRVRISIIDQWSMMFEKQCVVHMEQLPTEELRTTFDAAMHKLVTVLVEKSETVARDALKDYQCYCAERSFTYSFADSSFRNSKLERVVGLQRANVEKECVACSGVFTDHLQNITTLTVLLDAVSLGQYEAIVYPTGPPSFISLLGDAYDASSKKISGGLCECASISLSAAQTFLRCIYEQRYGMHRTATSVFGALSCGHPQDVWATNFYFFGHFALLPFLDAMKSSSSVQGYHPHTQRFVFYKIEKRSWESSCLLLLDYYRYLCGFLCFQFGVLESVDGRKDYSVTTNWWRVVAPTNAGMSAVFLFWPFNAERKITVGFFAKYLMHWVPLHLAPPLASPTEPSPSGATTTQDGGSPQANGMGFIEVINVPASLSALGVHAALYDQKSKTFRCFSERGDQLFYFSHMDRIEGLFRLFKICWRAPVFLKVGVNRETNSEGLAVRLLFLTMSGKSDASVQNLAHYVKKINVSLPMSSGSVCFAFDTLIERLEFQYQFIRMVKQFSPNHAAEWRFKIKKPRTFFHLWKVLRPLLDRTGIEFYFERQTAGGKDFYLLHRRSPEGNEVSTVKVSSDASAFSQVYQFLSQGHQRTLEDELLLLYLPHHIDTSTVVHRTSDFLHSFVSGSYIVTVSEKNVATVRVKITSEWSIELASIPVESKENVKRDLAVAFLKTHFPRVLEAAELQEHLHASLVQLEKLAPLCNDGLPLSFFINASSPNSCLLLKTPKTHRGEVNLSESVEIIATHSETVGCNSKLGQLQALHEKMVIYANFLAAKTAASLQPSKKHTVKLHGSFFHYANRLLTMQYHCQTIYHTYNIQEKRATLFIQRTNERSVSETVELASMHCEQNDLLYGLLQLYMSALHVPNATARTSEAMEEASLNLSRVEVALGLSCALTQFISFSRQGNAWKMTLLLPLTLLHFSVTGGAEESSSCIEICFSAPTKKRALSLLQAYLEQAVMAPCLRIQKVTNTLLTIKSPPQRRGFVRKTNPPIFASHLTEDANKVLSPEGNVFQHVHDAVLAGVQHLTETRSGALSITCSPLLGLSIVYMIPAARVASRQRRVKRVNTKVTWVELFTGQWEQALWPPLHILFALLEVYGKVLSEEEHVRASQTLLTVVERCVAAISTQSERLFCVSFFSSLCGWPTIVDDGSEKKEGVVIKEPVYFHVCVRERCEYTGVFYASVQFVKRNAAPHSVFVKEMLSVAEPTRELALSTLWLYWTAHILTVLETPTLHDFNTSALMNTFQKIL